MKPNPSDRQYTLGDNTHHTVGPFRITLSPSEKRFDSIPGRSVLDAGLSAGLALPFGCSNGNCGSCRARLISGTMRQLQHHDYTFTQAEKLRGDCLLCANEATSDCTIEVIEAASSTEIPQQQLQAKLCRFDTLPDCDIVAMKFTRGRMFRFLPGQNAELTFPDGFTTILPIASCPCNAQALEFHLNADVVTDYVLEQIKNQLKQMGSRDRITITGPSGQFTLHNTGSVSAASEPVLFIARGGDFAQLQGLIEQLFNLEWDTASALLWQATATTQHYLHNLCRSWHDAIDEFDYVPVAADDDLLRHLPPAWQALLPHARVYLGSANTELVEQISACGVELQNIFYPAD